MQELIKDLLALIGGIGIIIIGVTKFFGNIIQSKLKEKNRKQTEEELERNRQIYGNRRVQADRFVNTQYEVYVELWKNLQGMKLAVDALWNKVNDNNIMGLASQLENLQKQLSNWSLFFEKKHLEEIRSILNILENFHSGKMNLNRLRNSYEEEIPIFFSEELEEEIINKNQNYKIRFENVINKIRDDFQSKLSQIA